MGCECDDEKEEQEEQEREEEGGSSRGPRLFTARQSQQQQHTKIQTDFLQKIEMQSDAQCTHTRKAVEKT